MLSCKINVIMKELFEYVNDLIGLPFQIDVTERDWGKILPMYLTASYTIKAARMLNLKVAIAMPNTVDEQPTVSQLRRHMENIRQFTNTPVIFVFDKMEAYNRRRMVQQQVNFIVPFKQLFVPELLMAFTELKGDKTPKAAHFTPMAQLLTFYWLLCREEDIPVEDVPLNEIAALFETNAMAITRAADNMAELDICRRTPGREKSLQFNYSKAETWHIIKQRNLAINPVQKTVFIDERPPVEQLLTTNINALAAYTDLNPVAQSWYAIDKTAYQAYKKTNQWPRENRREGRFAIEVWKYNPALLRQKLLWLENTTDPLSLYYYFANDADERIQDALAQLEKQQTWLEE